MSEPITGLIFGGMDRLFAFEPKFIRSFWNDGLEQLWCGGLLRAWDELTQLLELRHRAWVGDNVGEIFFGDSARPH